MDKQKPKAKRKLLDDFALQPSDAKSKSKPSNNSKQPGVEPSTSRGKKATVDIITKCKPLKRKPLPKGGINKDVTQAKNQKRVPKNSNTNRNKPTSMSRPKLIPIIQTCGMKARANIPADQDTDIQKILSIDNLSPVEFAAADQVVNDNDSGANQDGIDLSIQGSDFEDEVDETARNEPGEITSSDNESEDES